MAQFPLIDQASIAMIPGAYKESKVYSQLPTDGSADFTFSRGTDNATIVNEEGLIEKGYENFLLQSNSFDTTWVQTLVNLTGNQQGYNGENNAWLIEANNASNFNGMRQDVSVSSGVLSISVYAKAGSTQFLGIYFNGSATGNLNFDLSGEGEVGNPWNAGLFGQIKKVENTDWYRCTFVINESIAQIRIGARRAISSFASDIGDTIYIQDAQINQGLVAYPYLETTTAPAYGGITANQPRLNYTGDCPSLLVEEGRTNDIDNSEYINSPAAATISRNDGISPEGVENAIKVTLAGVSQSGISTSNAYVSLNKTYTQSCYVKKDVGDYFGFGLFQSGMPINNNNYIRWNLSDITIQPDVQGSYTNGKAEDFGNGWIRLSATITTVGNGSRSGWKFLGMRYNSFQASNIGDSFYLYGLQAEPNATYASSYIPTYGSAQTRAAETLTATKTLPSEGTLYINVGGTTQPKLSVLGEYFDASTTANKVAIAYSATALKISHNGSIVVDKTGTYDVSSLTEIDLGHDGGTDQADTSIGEFITFGSFLTTTELNALTQ